MNLRFIIISFLFLFIFSFSNLNYSSVSTKLVSDSQIFFEVKNSTFHISFSSVILNNQIYFLYATKSSACYASHIFVKIIGYNLSFCKVDDGNLNIESCIFQPNCKTQSSLFQLVKGSKISAADVFGTDLYFYSLTSLEHFPIISNQFINTLQIDSCIFSNITTYLSRNSSFGYKDKHDQQTTFGIFKNSLFLNVDDPLSGGIVQIAYDDHREHVAPIIFFLSKNNSYFHSCKEFVYDSRLFLVNSRSFEKDSFFSCFSTLPGGAICSLAASSDFSFINCVFDNCSSKSYGGSIYVKSNKLTIDSCLFTSSVSGASGGGIFANCNELIIKSTNCSKSICSGCGGFYFLNTSQEFLFLVDNILNNCSALGNTIAKGGGICIASVKNVSISNSIFYCCSCKTDSNKEIDNFTIYGGALDIELKDNISYSYSSFSLLYCYFVNNTCLNGNDIHLKTEGLLEVRNSGLSSYILPDWLTTSSSLSLSNYPHFIFNDSPLYDFLPSVIIIKEGGGKGGGKCNISSPFPSLCGTSINPCSTFEDAISMLNIEEEGVNGILTLNNEYLSEESYALIIILSNIHLNKTMIIHNKMFDVEGNKNYEFGKREEKMEERIKISMGEYGGNDRIRGRINEEDGYINTKDRIIMFDVSYSDIFFSNIQYEVELKERENGNYESILCFLVWNGSKLYINNCVILFNNHIPPFSSSSLPSLFTNSLIKEGLIESKGSVVIIKESTIRGPRYSYNIIKANNNSGSINDDDNNYYNSSTSRQSHSSFSNDDDNNNNYNYNSVCINDEEALINSNNGFVNIFSSSITHASNTGIKVINASLSLFHTFFYSNYVLNQNSFSFSSSFSLNSFNSSSFPSLRRNVVAVESSVTSNFTVNLFKSLSKNNNEEKMEEEELEIENNSLWFILDNCFTGGSDFDCRNIRPEKRDKEEIEERKEVKDNDNDYCYITGDCYEELDCIASGNCSEKELLEYKHFKVYERRKKEIKKDYVNYSSKQSNNERGCLPIKYTFTKSTITSVSISNASFISSSSSSSSSSSLSLSLSSSLSSSKHLSNLKNITNSLNVSFKLIGKRFFPCSLSIVDSSQSPIISSLFINENTIEGNHIIIINDSLFKMLLEKKNEEGKEKHFYYNISFFLLHSSKNLYSSDSIISIPFTFTLDLLDILNEANFTPPFPPNQTSSSDDNKDNNNKDGNINMYIYSIIFGIIGGIIGGIIALLVCFLCCHSKSKNKDWRSEDRKKSKVKIEEEQKIDNQLNTCKYKEVISDSFLLPPFALSSEFFSASTAEIDKNVVNNKEILHNKKVNYQEMSEELENNELTYIPNELNLVSINRVIDCDNNNNSSLSSVLPLSSVSYLPNSLPSSPNNFSSNHFQEFICNPYLSPDYVNQRKNEGEEVREEEEKN